MVAGDTAGAAKLVAELKDRTMAALAPRLAAALYGLDILEENVEDTDTNVTRFVVLTRNKQWIERPSAEAKMMTTFIFRVRNVPAALYKAMGGFATNGVNMTKLESYQLGAFTATLFYADIEGHPDDPGVKNALEELRFFSREVRILGVYPAKRLARRVEGGGLGCGPIKVLASVLVYDSRLLEGRRDGAATNFGDAARPFPRLRQYLVR